MKMHIVQTLFPSQVIYHVCIYAKDIINIVNKTQNIQSFESFFYHTFELKIYASGSLQMLSLKV